MSRVRQKHTKPELIVRKALHRMGLRFRLQRRDLPGSPDIVLPRHKTVIFVHGCFWHRHAQCQKTTTPKTRVEFWKHKFDANVARDRRNAELLQTMGWKVITVWECEAKTVEDAADTLARELAIAG